MQKLTETHMFHHISPLCFSLPFSFICQRPKIYAVIWFWMNEYKHFKQNGRLGDRGNMHNLTLYMLTHHKNQPTCDPFCFSTSNSVEWWKNGTNGKTIKQKINALYWNLSPPTMEHFIAVVIFLLLLLPWLFLRLSLMSFCCTLYLLTFAPHLHLCKNRLVGLLMDCGHITMIWILKHSKSF